MTAKLLTQDDFEDAQFVQTQIAEDISLQQEDIDNQINSIFSEVGIDKNDVHFHFQVWQLKENEADASYCFTGTVDDLPIMDRLRDEFDGGKFRIQIYRNKKRFRRITVKIRPSKNVNVSRAIKNDMAEMLRVMGQQQQENFAMLKDTVLQMVGKPSTPQPSQMEMMTGMMMLMKSMKDFVSPPSAAPAFDPEKMFDMFLRGIEMGRETGGSSETGLMDIAKELIKSPLLGELAKAGHMQAPPSLPRVPRIDPQAMASMGSERSVMPNPVQIRPVGPAPPLTPSDSERPLSPKPAQSLASAPLPEEPAMSNDVLKYYLDILIQKAGQDSDPVLYAELILDSVPLEIIENIIMRDDLIDYASSFDSRIKAHENWFLELRDHIRGALTDPGDEDDISSDESPVLNAANHSTGDGGDPPNP